jgi:hypothetical protein
MLCDSFGVAEDLPAGWARGSGQHEGQLWNGKKWVDDPGAQKQANNKALPVTAKGVNGEITFNGLTLVITRKGALGRLSAGKGERRIPLSAIQAVQWKPPGPVVNGFISFNVAGSIDRNPGFGGATWSAVDDENAVVVKKSQEKEMLRLRDEIEAALAKRQN